MLKRSIFTTSHLQTFSYPLEKKLAVDLDADVKIRLWKGCMFCLCHRVMEKAQCALEWQDSLRGLVLRDVPQCPVGHKLVDSGNLHQGHFGVMVHLSPGALFEGPGLYFLNFQPGNTQEPWRTTHRPGMVRAFGFEDTLTSVLRGWLGHNQSLGLPGHLEGSVRTPKWPAKGHRAVRAV